MHPGRMVSADTGWCRADELETIRRYLNEEFIHSRGRSIGLERRFPGVLDALSNIVVRRVRGQIVAALALKRFTWETPAMPYRAAMIGLVWTKASARGQGHAKAILEYVRRMLREEERDFAVLWTSQPHVYSSSGWIGADCGLYGVIEGQPRAGTGEAVDVANTSLIRSLRREHCATRVAPEVSAGFTLLPTAVELRLLVEADSYAIVGLAPHNAYVFDIHAPATAMPALWPQIATLGEQIHMNIASGTPAEEWLARTFEIRLPPCPLAMWLPLSSHSHSIDFSRAYIPFIDRL